MNKVRLLHLELLPADQLRPYFHFITCYLNSETESKVTGQFINSNIYDLYWKVNFSEDKGIACVFETW
jgi:hypothetical protein